MLPPLRARAGHLDIWCVDLDLPADALASCERPLDGQERARAERFARPQDRRRYVVSHAALRHLLACSSGLAAADLRFFAGPQGKPELSPDMPADLSFSLSRSGEMALIGITASARLGIDIEQIRPVDDAGMIARSLFSASERTGLETVPAERRASAFLTCWTRKEAFVKALGAGLSHPLDRFEVSLAREEPRLLAVDGDAEAASRWTVLHLEPTGRFVGAAVIVGRATHRMRPLAPDWVRDVR